MIVLVNKLTDVDYLSNQGKTFRNAGWDFSIGGSQGTGTVRSAVRPPPIRAKGEENVNEGAATPKKNSDGDSQWLSASGNGLYESSEVSLGRYSRDEDKQNTLHQYVSLLLSSGVLLPIEWPLYVCCLHVCIFFSRMLGEAKSLIKIVCLGLS